MKTSNAIQTITSMSSRVAVILLLSLIIIGSDVFQVNTSSAQSGGIKNPPFSPGSIIGNDDRVRVTKTTEAPWKYIADLDIDFPSKQGAPDAQCTGFFIDSNVILTAGHCIYYYKNKDRPELGTEFATSITIIPGENGIYTPFGLQTSKEFYVPDEWRDSLDTNYDYGIIILSDRKLGDRVGGSFFAQALSDMELQNKIVDVAGYPGDKGNGDQLWRSADKIKSVTANIIRYPIDTYGGQSGSPVWFFDASIQQYVVIGVHTNGTDSTLSQGYNYGTRITHQVIQQILTWQPLQTPTLSTPTNGSSGEILRPMFSWSPVPTAERYGIQISLDPSFNSWDEIVHYTSSLFFVPETDLLPGKTYYWRVWAIRGEDSSPFSEVWHFTTASTSPPTPTPIPPTPTPNPRDHTPPSASGYNVSITNGTAHLAPSGVQDNPGGSGVREVRFSAKFDGKWRGIGVATAPPYSLDWNMCAMNVPDGDIEFGMEVWDNAGNKWIWSQHYPNPHAQKHYDCQGQSLQEGVYLFYETGQNFSQPHCRVVVDTASVGNACGSQFNDHVKSIKVVGSYYFALYKDDNFGGGQPLSGNFSDNLPSEWQTVVSSVRVRRTDPAIVTFSSLTNYNGEHWKTDRTIYDLGHWNWNDKAQSVEVLPGYGAIICADSDFHGICGRVGANENQRKWTDINALANGLKNAVSSVQICNGDCPPAPSAPTLASPGASSRLAPGEAVVLQWQGSARQYQVEYWGGGLSGRQKTSWEAGTQRNLGILPSSRTPYYWRVRGWNEYGEGPWSDAYSFTIYANQAPSAPVQVSPANNSIHTQLPQLCWQAVQDPDGDSVQYWVDLMGAEYAQSGWISTTCWQPTVSKRGVYTWHVQSRDSFGAKSAYSSNWTFVVQDPATNTPTPSPTFTPTPTPTPTPIPVWRFSGFTYQGQPDTAAALGGVILHLYGRNDGEPEPGNWRKSVISDAGGYFNFHIIEPWNFDHFTLVAEPPEGLAAVSAWSANGNVIAPDTITWDYPQPGSHENRFYFDVPTPTPTPTSTPTATPTPSRQWLPVIIAP